MSHNRATIYSNGIADFQRIYKISKKSGTKISIPVCQSHLADVLASLTISGNVSIESPPSYQPANQDVGTVDISPENALLSLATQLTGAEIELSTTAESYRGRLVGIHTQQQGTEGEPIQRHFLVLMQGANLRRLPMNEIDTFVFTDSDVQAEIGKALSRRIREIKPNSTFVELELSSSTAKAEAIIQYTIPAAAWKISYRMLLDGNAPIEFHGHAIVDNNTDEDWDSFIISVVMGQPITFSTDLADSKTPHREHKNIVQESAIGAVEIEEAMLVKMAAGGEPDADYLKHGSRMSLKQRAPSMPTRSASASVDAAKVEETGDFCIFESPGPVSIDARRSAVIPVFQSELPESSPALHYKIQNHKDRPFRTIRFQNTTNHSLGRGVCTVYDQTTFVGTCIVPATKPDGVAMLPHALETGVRIRAEHETRRRRVGVRISDGVAYESHHELRQTDYLINNNHDDSFPFVLDHDRLIAKSDLQVELHRDDQDSVAVNPTALDHGVRVEFTLAASDVLIVRVVETKISRSRVSLVGKSPDDDSFQVAWLYKNVVESNASLSENVEVRRCIELKRRLEEKADQVLHAQNEIERLEKRQERLRKNIGTGGGQQQALKWQTDLGRAEDAIVQLEEDHLPELRKERLDLQRDLYAGLKELAMEWND